MGQKISQVGGPLRFSGLKIIVPFSQRKYLQNLLSEPYALDYRQLRYNVTLYGLSEALPEFPCSVEVFNLEHPIPTQAVRLMVRSKIISYCTDTGYCANAVDAARAADLLIAECAYLPGEEDPEWPHLNPQSAARLAREAQAQRLILVQFEAFRCRSFAQRAEAEKKAQANFHQTQIARDGLVFQF